MNTIFQNKRIVYIDILRILSIIAVIILHITAGPLTRTNDFNTTSWWVSNIFNSVSRFAVPVFFMISGAMILRVEIKSYGDFYKKRVLPLFIPLISWSFIYGWYNQYYILKSNIGVGEFLLDFGYKLLVDRNYVHLWFLYAIIAIYSTVPLISKLIKNATEKDIRYYLIMWFIVSVLYRFVSEIIFRWTNHYIDISILNIPMFMGFLGYFILGYYVFNYDLPIKWKNSFYNLGVISFFLTPILTYFASMYSGILDEMFYGNYSITTFFMAMAMFLFFKEKEMSIHNKTNYKIQKMISSLSKASFSIYLIHLLVELIATNSIDTEATLLETLLSLLFNIMTIFTISYFAVKVLNLNKWVTQVLFGGRG
ncbi:acyltransferase family protein [Paenibacillus sp. N1-5-1-14]|uniref:acyltransferase n=1 Tax=Paenibacillus radicibacter TaxID=2972488 RepID=UPI0021595793|nr:acyltransferase family protein [Paenibacillus radicibacter]MCR8643297.1 acyltransferase family protein [Paenibacillus radicibacter]